jgi:hypothetical protein
MPVIPVKRVVDPKKNNQKKWRAKEEERQVTDPPPSKNVFSTFYTQICIIPIHIRSHVAAFQCIGRYQS